MLECLKYLLILFSTSLTLSSNTVDLNWKDIAKKPVYFDVIERQEIMYAITIKEFRKVGGTYKE